MRKLIVTENITLDGVIEMTGDWFDPQGGGDDLQEAMHEHDAACDAVLLGRQTYEDFKSYWPLLTDDTTGVTDYLNRTEKYVVTSTMKETDWENTTFLRGPLVEEIARLKAQPGKEIVATGSITLVRALIEAGLVDEYRLFVYPVVVGEGKRLFDSGHNHKLRLVDSRGFSSGVALLTYRAVREGEEGR